MKKVLKWIGITLVSLFVLGMIINANKTPEQKAADSLAREQQKNLQKKYTLQPRELAVLDFLLKEDSAVFLRGGKAILFENVLAVSAIDVAKEYEKNQVSADQKYFEKSLLVTGRISSINSGLGNEPYVVLRGANIFLSPQIHFDKNNAEKIATLEKGQKLSFVCVGAGAVVGSPMFKKCSFADDYAAKIVTETKSEVLAFLSGDNIKSEEVKKLVVGAITIAREIPESSTCFTNGSNCSKEIKVALGSDVLEQKKASVLEELKLLGVLVGAM